MMTNEQLAPARHTLAHLLAAAVRELYPHAQPTIGPAIDTGFYYDFDFGSGEKPGEQDLQKIEQKMRELLKRWDAIEGEKVKEEQAREIFSHNPYKLELIDEILGRAEDLTLYHTKHGGETVFTDLCRGGHSEHPKNDIASGGFKLERVAGAYWRGDEKSQMLTRIYGLAFATKDDLAAYETLLEEAKKRDHKKLGRELDLFTFSDLVGAGLPLWTPRGTLVRDLLDMYVWELRRVRGYEKVEIPHITKKDLYITSGHWDKFKEELFRITTREGHEFAMKPMNCPHHTQIYARKAWSYRELPQRYANSTTCYRDEQSGELSGLSRVRAFMQDDAHVFCRMSQVKEEFLHIWDIVQEFYGTFGFTLRVRISTHDPKQPDKYLGDKERWAFAEAMLADIARERNVDAFAGVGEAAFYGPKLDFMAQDALGREWQVATIQLDMNLPERFDLTCTNEKGEKERIVMIHAAIMGSVERFLSILIEHTGGELPFWLAPVQLRIVPVSAAHDNASQALSHDIRIHGVRVECDNTDDSLGKRIRACKLDKVPAYIVVGDKEVEGATYTIEWRSGDKETYARDALMTKIHTLTTVRNT